MVKTTKAIFLLAITMAFIVALTMRNSVIPSSSIDHDQGEVKDLPSKRVSRFLAQNIHERNPRAADHCHKDYEICSLPEFGANSTCCNNKCVDLGIDNHNCGACKNKCKYTESCCRGQCVNLSYDKRHCGHCNNRCLPGQYCIYAMCDYA